MNVNEVLAARADRRLAAAGSGAGPVDPKQHVAASQSTADVCHTAFRLAVVVETRSLLGAVERLVEALRTVAAELADIPTLARTCLQDATSAPLSTVLDGSADAIRRRSGALRTTLGPLHDVVLGTTVIGLGTGAPSGYRTCVVTQLADVAGMALRPHPTAPAPSSTATTWPWCPRAWRCSAGCCSSSAPTSACSRPVLVAASASSSCPK